MAQKITIAIETCFLFDQLKNRGVGRYGREIYQRLIKDGELNGQEVKILWLGFNDLQDNLNKLFEGNLPTYFAEIEFQSLGEPQLSSPLNNIRLLNSKIRPLIHKYQPDLYFAIYFERGLPVDLVPTIVTAHDAIPMRTGRFSSKPGLVGWLKGQFYKVMWYKQIKAAAIVTVSNTSKLELIKYGHLPEQNISVVYSGVSDIFFKPEASLGDWSVELPFDYLKSDYLIYDAGLEANKNIEELWQNFAALIAVKPDLKLVVTGNDFKPSNNIVTAENLNERAIKYTKLAKDLGIAQNIIPVGRVSEPTLVGLLKNAQAYVNFSDFEGFGFGPLQAMAAGVPAIISNNPCFVEVSGAASLVLNPSQVASNIEQILKVLTEQKTRQLLINKGTQHVQGFNWDNTWTETKAILSKVCASHL